MKNLIFATSLVFCLNAGAEVNEQALSQTQDLLRDSGLKESHINESSPQVKQALQMLRGMGMTKSQEDALFGIAADSFGDMLKAANGDTSKLKEQLAKGMNNPEEFLKSIGGDAQSRIRELSSEVEGFNTSGRK